MEANRIIANGVEYMPVSEAGPRPQTTKQIVVLPRGFVYVGDYRVEGEMGIIENAQNIRRWGTSRGLGELALNGPQPETKLDPCGVIRFNVRSVVHTMDVNQAKW